VIMVAVQAGRFKFKGSNLEVGRVGYGAMQLAGPHAWGPPRDKGAACRILQHAVALGMNHIDTADYYGPHITNQIIKAALYPYPRDLVIVTKVGTKRTPDHGWAVALSPQELVSAVHDNLRNLGLDALHAVNLRVGAPIGLREGSIEEPLGILVNLQQQGLIQHIGISNATPAQVRQARAMTNIIGVQNHYNRRLQADSVVEAPGGCKRNWKNSDAGCAGMAFTEVAECSGNPGNFVDGAFARKLGGAWPETLGGDDRVIEHGLPGWRQE
jgi:aryl-alcohol dehydrogenase-like predicted oxidoreductase